VTERTKELNRARIQRYKERHRALGLCVECSLPAQKPHILCEDHHQNHNERSRRLRAMNKVEGCCPMCGHKLHPQRDEGRVNCMDCREVYPRERRAHLY